MLLLTAESPDPTKELEGQNGKALYTEERLKSGLWDIFSKEKGKASYTEERLKVDTRLAILEARTLQRGQSVKMARRCIRKRGSKGSLRTFPADKMARRRILKRGSS